MIPFERPIYLTKPLLPAREAYQEILARLWETHQLTNAGPYHDALETALAQYLRASNLTLTSSGTSALMLALRAHEVTGRVLTSPLTFPATVNAIVWAGCEPVFGDIDPDSLTLSGEWYRDQDMESINLGAIVPVHLFGVPCDGFKWNPNGSLPKIVYDGAHAFGTRVDGNPVHEWGTATAYSFHATKLFHAAEGGGIVSNHVEPKQLRTLRNHGWDGSQFLYAGLNAKMSEFHAILGLEVLKMVSVERFKRLRIGSIYQERLSKIAGFIPILAPDGTELSLQYYPVRHRKRDAIFDALKRINVHARAYCWPLVSNQESFRQLPSARPGLLPNANQAAREILCLPFYGQLEDDAVHRICDAIEEAIYQPTRVPYFTPDGEGPWDDEELYGESAL